MAKSKFIPPPTVAYHIGHDISRPIQPVVLCLSVAGNKLPTTWSLNDAEAMGYALLKHVELAKRKLGANGVNFTT